MEDLKFGQKISVMALAVRIAEVRNDDIVKIYRKLVKAIKDEDDGRSSNTD